jgi:hypothetical protein
MALVVADRVQQTGTANTTVSFTLSGSVTGFQSFAVIGDTNTTYYAATDGSGSWEVGVGTYSTTGPTLTRTTILSSSNSGSAVTFSGTVNVFVTYPSGKAIYEDASNNVGIGNEPSGLYRLEVTGKTYASGGFVPRPTSITSASTITPTSDVSDQYNVTALAVPATLASPSGTPTDGQKLIIRIKDDGTARALTWTTGSSGAYRAVGVTLPTTTVINKTVYIGCIYNTADSRWDAVAVAQEA